MQSRVSLLLVRPVPDRQDLRKCQRGLQGAAGPNMNAEIRWIAAIQAMKVSARLDEARIETFAGRTIKTLLDPGATGTRGLTLGVIIYEPGCIVEPHTHSDQEALYVLKGRGEARIGSETVELRPGTAVYMREGVVHSVVNPSTDPIEAVLIHAPTSTT